MVNKMLTEPRQTARLVSILVQVFARLAPALEDVRGDAALLELLAELQAHEPARRVRDTLM